MNENDETQRRLAEVIRLLEEMPIIWGSSSKEPAIQIRQIDLTKVIEVAKGETDPAEWVSVSCEHSKQFGHTPHHWSEYREGEIPLRVPHYCDGNFAEGVSA